MNLKKLSIVLVGFLFLASLCISAEFKDGDVYTVSHIQGYVHVTCDYMRDGRWYKDHHSVLCAEDFISPVSHSRFVHEGSLAEKVKLTSNLNVSKTKKFYPEKGESKRFNLLIRTLFQKPLLVPGNNLINYQLLLEDDIIEAQGNFEILVLENQRWCPTRFVHSFNQEDCQGFFICNRYLYETGCLY